MALISLTLTGFIGIRNGLHRDSIELNFRDLVGDATLVALTGDNGRGKTTVLDNMTYYPVMPSQLKGGRAGAFSYYAEVYLPENHSILVWDHGGRVYRKHLVIRLNGKRRTEAYLHVQQDGRWKPVATPDGTVSDGKMETYLRCVEHVCEPQSIFLTTCFLAQNRKLLSTYPNAEIKLLFGEMLELDDIRELGTRAGETARLLRTGLQPIRQQRQLRQDEAAALANELASLRDGSRQADMLRQAVDAAKAQLVQAQARCAALAAQASVDVQFKTQRDALEAERNDIAARHRSAMEAFAQRRRTRQRTHDELVNSIARRASERQRALVALQRQHALLTGTLTLRETVSRAVSALPRRQTVLDGRRQQVGQLQDRVRTATALQNGIAQLRLQVTATERAAGKAVLHANDLKRRYQLTGEVPCAGTDLQPLCKLLADANAARPLMPSADAEVARLAAERQRLTSRIDVLGCEQAALGDPAEQLQRATVKLQRSDQRLRATAALAARCQDVEAAAKTLTIVETQITHLTRDMESEQNEDAARLQAFEDDLGGLVREQAAARAQFEVDSARVDTALAALPPPFDRQQLEDAQRQLSSAVVTVDGCERRLKEATAAHQRYEDTTMRLRAAQGALAGVDRQIADIESAHARWTMLTKALGNDGIIALSIDDAGPELAVLTNELLLACYGPRFTVSMQTQVESARGELGEGFVIMVHDADTGDAAPLAKKSAGERVWINDCLTRAMALYRARRSATRSDTLFSDETDGAFSASHKRMFMAMKRRVLAIGNYRQEFFISHTPEMVELADAVIDLDAYAASTSANPPIKPSSLSQDQARVY